MEPEGCVRLWLVDFGKAGLFRCQSAPRAMLSLFDAGVLISEFSASWIRWIWLGAFGKAGFFRCQSWSFRPTFWPPLQPWFAKETAFLSAKAQKLQKAALFAIVCRIFYGGILVWLSHSGRFVF